MLKFRHAVFCYYITRFNRGFQTWLLIIKESVKSDSLLSVEESTRQQISNWFSGLLDKKLDFDTVVHLLSGDIFYERNRMDISKLESEIRRPITSVWDTDAIFTKYPHLKTFGRNKEFEEMWAAKKNKAKEKQK